MNKLEIELSLKTRHMSAVQNLAQPWIALRALSIDSTSLSSFLNAQFIEIDNLGEYWGHKLGNLISEVDQLINGSAVERELELPPWIAPNADVLSAGLVLSHAWLERTITLGRIPKAFDEVEPSQSHLDLFLNNLRKQVISSSVNELSYLYLAIVELLLRYDPRLIPNDLSLSWHETLETGSWDELIEYGVAKYVNTLGWRGNAENHAKYFDKTLKQPLGLEPEDLRICQDAEAYRHAIVHGGRVNDTLIRRLSVVDLKLGDELVFTDEFLSDVFSSTCRYATEMARSALKFIGASGPPFDPRFETQNSQVD